MAQSNSKPQLIEMLWYDVERDKFLQTVKKKEPKLLHQDERGWWSHADHFKYHAETI